MPPIDLPCLQTALAYASCPALWPICTVPGGACPHLGGGGRIKEGKMMREGNRRKEEGSEIRDGREAQ